MRRHVPRGAVERTLFLQPGTLEIEGAGYRFRAGDAVLLSPNEVPGTHHTSPYTSVIFPAVLRQEFTKRLEMP
jgi:hypothetical protein